MNTPECSIASHCSIALHRAKNLAWCAKGTCLVSLSNKSSTVDQVCCKKWKERKTERVIYKRVLSIYTVESANMPQLVSQNSGLLSILAY